MKNPPLKKFPSRIYGVDFSGAAKAGKKIWISSGIIEGGALKIDDCFSGTMLPDSGIGRDHCLIALINFIARKRDSAFGLDFPFGLPRCLFYENSWEEFILSFPEKYPNQDIFRDICYKLAGNSEIKRVTDKENSTPFSPYNLRLYKQTYFGIRGVLHPLVRNHLVCVLPMQRIKSGKPWILEVCPASTLKRENLYFPYKNKRHKKVREHILKEIEAKGVLSIQSSRIRSEIADDDEGNALDSIIAAFATFRALLSPFRLFVKKDSIYALEGYVFV
ncbi:MAG: hypothetical protein QMC83_05785 [Thermodesulfovibrionales bacterium]|nr:hypothetical protein [Thermodesulfovibrionales bacterium]